MGDDVILAYIKNSGASYNLSADDILYLNTQGVSKPVLSALLQAKVQRRSRSRDDAGYSSAPGKSGLGVPYPALVSPYPAQVSPYPGRLYARANGPAACIGG